MRARVSPHFCQVDRTPAGPPLRTTDNVPRLAFMIPASAESVKVSMPLVERKRWRGVSRKTRASSSRNAPVGVVDDIDLVRAEQLLRDHHTPHSLGSAAASVANDMHVSLGEAEHFGGQNASVHAHLQRREAVRKGRSQRKLRPSLSKKVMDRGARAAGLPPRPPCGLAAWAAGPPAAPPRTPRWPP